MRGRKKLANFEGELTHSKQANSHMKLAKTEPSITRHDNENQKNVIPHQGRKQRTNRNEIIHQHSYGNFKRLRQTFNSTIKHRVDPFGMVINLSKLNLSVYEFKILGYEFKFYTHTKLC